MSKAIAGGIAASVALIAGLAGPVAAQDNSFVEQKGDWRVHVAASPKECWGVSEPTSWKATKDGSEVQVNRGKSYLFVTFRPGQGGEVSYAGGYPFAGGSTVEVAIGGTKFNLFTEGENAWGGSPADDAKIIAAMKSGSSAVITSRSGRGNVITDTFSLTGSSAALGGAESRCK
ncbi:hypothetical protein ACEYYB_10905 [Paracoccus sp. p4-l81]|uniref:hypothetical protein n=1 Tax=unclassified Paracoccus (in: a-proteobacteria) TaxID=2688777 RepID=UPI0035BB284A